MAPRLEIRCQLLCKIAEILCNVQSMKMSDFGSSSEGCSRFRSELEGAQPVEAGQEINLMDVFSCFQPYNPNLLVRIVVHDLGIPPEEG